MDWGYSLVVSTCLTFARPGDHYPAPQITAKPFMWEMKKCFTNFSPSVSDHKCIEIPELKKGGFLSILEDFYWRSRKKAIYTTFP